MGIQPREPAPPASLKLWGVIVATFRKGRMLSLMRVGYGTITRVLSHPKEGYEKIEGFFVYPLNCARVSITFAKVIPPDPLPEDVGERFEFSWIVPKDRPWKIGDRLAVKFFEFGGLPR
jgi:hypothetical protein